MAHGKNCECAICKGVQAGNKIIRDIKASEKRDGKK